VWLTVITLAYLCYQERQRMLGRWQSLRSWFAVHRRGLQ
jgi:hypothetical protein